MIRVGEDKLHDELLAGRLKSRRETIDYLAAQAKEDSEELKRAFTEHSQVDDEICRLEDLLDAEMIELKMETLEEIKLVTSEARDNMQRISHCALEDLYATADVFRARIVKSFQNLACGWKEDFEAIANEKRQIMRAAILEHTEARNVHVSILESLKKELADATENVVKHKAILTQLRRKNDSLLRPYNSLKEEIANLEQRLVEHQRTEHPKLEPLKNRFNKLTKELKEAKFRLEVLRLQKDTTDCMSVSTCSSLNS